jgi:hypothetical protein
LATALAYWLDVMFPFASIALRTSSRRAIACAGRWKGSKTDGACGNPASNADWFSVSLLAGFEKYVCAAASIP